MRHLSVRTCLDQSKLLGRTRVSIYAERVYVDVESYLFTGGGNGQCRISTDQSGRVALDGEIGQNDCRLDATSKFEITLPRILPPALPVLQGDPRHERHVPNARGDR